MEIWELGIGNWELGIEAGFICFIGVIHAPAFVFPESPKGFTRNQVRFYPKPLEVLPETCTGFARNLLRFCLKPVRVSGACLPEDFGLCTVFKGIKNALAGVAADAHRADAVRLAAALGCHRSSGGAAVHGIGLVKAEKGMRHKIKRDC